MARAKVTVKMNPGWEKTLTEQLTQSPKWKKIEEDLNQRVNAVVSGTAGAMSGGDVEVIHAELVRRVKAEGVEPNISRLHKIAQEIADGTRK